MAIQLSVKQRRTRYQIERGSGSSVTRRITSSVGVGGGGAIPNADINSFAPNTDQTITGNWDFTGGLTINGVDALSDADSNGITYGRKDGAWVDVSTTVAINWGSILGTLSDQTDLQLALDGKLGTTEKAADSNLLDSLNSTQFLRSDVDDAFSGTISRLAAGEAMFIGGSSVDNADTWIRIGNGDINWNLKYIGSTSGFDGNELRIESTSTGSYIQIDHNTNFEIYNGTTLGKVWNTFNDGSGSGMDSDLLDGQDGSYYLDSNNFTNIPSPTITIDGDANGVGTLTDLSNTTITIDVTDSSALSGLTASQFVRNDTILSNTLYDAAWIANNASTTNIDHIWHDDASNTFNFVSDGTLKSTGNSNLIAGSLAVSSGITINSEDVIVDADSDGVTYGRKDGAWVDLGNNEYTVIGTSDPNPFIAVSGGRYQYDLYQATGGRTINLPSSPNSGDVVRLHLSRVTDVDEALTVSGNGNNVQYKTLESTSITLGTYSNGEVIEFVYDNYSGNWIGNVLNEDKDPYFHTTSLSTSSGSPTPLSTYATSFSLANGGLVPIYVTLPDASYYFDGDIITVVAINFDTSRSLNIMATTNAYITKIGDSTLYQSGTVFTITTVQTPLSFMNIGGTWNQLY